MRDKYSVWKPGLGDVEPHPIHATFASRSARRLRPPSPRGTSCSGLLRQDCGVRAPSRELHPLPSVQPRVSGVDRAAATQNYCAVLDSILPIDAVSTHTTFPSIALSSDPKNHARLSCVTRSGLRDLCGC